MLEARTGAGHPVTGLAARREPDHVEEAALGEVADGSRVVDADHGVVRECGRRPVTERRLLLTDRVGARREVIERPAEVAQHPADGHARNGRRAHGFRHFADRPRRL